MSKLSPSVIRESSAWTETFAAEAGTYVHVGLELKDGAFVSGRLVWFSTDIEETGDRDLVLGPPLVVRAEQGVSDLQAERVLVASRDVIRIDVTYVDEPVAT